MATVAATDGRMSVQEDCKCKVEEVRAGILDLEIRTGYSSKRRTYPLVAELGQEVG